MDNDLYFDEFIECPHCRRIQEYPKSTKRKAEMACDHCGQKFRYYRNVMVEYATEKLEE